MVTHSPATTRVLTLVDDLQAESRFLDRRLASLGGEQWQVLTPAEPWSVADQISHLAYFDESASLAISDRDAFSRHLEGLLAAGESAPDLELSRALSHEALLDEWRSRRRALVEQAKRMALEDPRGRVPWYGPDMSPASFVSARLMETWAHGQDIADALGLEPSVSERLRHVIHLGVAARGFAFRIHGVGDPGDPVAVHTHNPTDETDGWTFGTEDAADTISGSALGLALVFTQRRWPEDTDVRAEGATAELFLSVAQAFAGPPGKRPRRRSGTPSEGGR